MPGRFSAATVAVDRELEHLQRFGHTLAEHAQAHDAHCKVGTAARLAVRPFARLHVDVVTIEFAKVPDHRMADVFGHLHRHAGIVEAHHFQARWQAQLQQGVHACTNVEQGLQIWLLVDELLGRRPDDGVVGLRCAGGPGRHLGLGKCFLQTLHPGGGVELFKTDGDVHGGILSARRRPFCRLG